MKVGDRVICIQGCYVEKGDKGTIVEVTNDYYGVKWDTLTTGHSCGGRCEPGKGWDINKSRAVRLNENINWRERLE